MKEMPSALRETVDFLGIKVDTVDIQGLYDRIVAFVKNGAPRKVMYVNADCVVLSRNDSDYLRILNGADLVYADGMSVVWGARILGASLPGRATGADLLPWFCPGFAERGYRIYLLGARPGVADAAAQQLKKASPSLNIVGVQHGYFRREENSQVIARIVEARPHILMVGMGAPYQEKWVEENFPLLNVPVVWTVGGALDFVSGRLSRGPRWLLDNGFEWLWRLLTEPTRLWKRYLVGNAKFSWYVFSYKLRSKKTKTQ